MLIQIKIFQIYKFNKSNTPKSWIQIRKYLILKFFQIEFFLNLFKPNLFSNLNKFNQNPTLMTLTQILHTSNRARTNASLIKVFVGLKIDEKLSIFLLSKSRAFLWSYNQVQRMDYWSDI